MFFLNQAIRTLIPSFFMSDVSKSLSSLTKNERPWALCSGRSPKMSDHEGIAQVAHQNWANERIPHCSFDYLLRTLKSSEQIVQVAHVKRAIVSKSLRSLMTNERFAQFAHDKWVDEQFTQNIWLKLYFLICFLDFFYTKRFAPSLSLFSWAMWANRWGCSPKMSDVSESLRLLTKTEWPWAICSGRSPKISVHEQFSQVAHQKWASMSESLRLLTKNERMSESLGFFLENCSFTPFFTRNERFAQNRWAKSQPWYCVLNSTLQSVPHGTMPQLM